MKIKIPNCLAYICWNVFLFLILFWTIGFIEWKWKIDFFFFVDMTILHCICGCHNFQLMNETNKNRICWIVLYASDCLCENVWIFIYNMYELFSLNYVDVNKARMRDRTRDGEGERTMSKAIAILVSFQTFCLCMCLQSIEKWW